MVWLTNLLGDFNVCLFLRRLQKRRQTRQAEKRKVKGVHDLSHFGVRGILSSLFNFVQLLSERSMHETMLRNLLNPSLFLPPFQEEQDSV